MRIWLAILVLLTAAGGAAAYFLLSAEGEEPSALDKHLATDAARRGSLLTSNCPEIYGGMHGDI